MTQKSNPHTGHNADPGTRPTSPAEQPTTTPPVQPDPESGAQGTVF